MYKLKLNLLDEELKRTNKGRILQAFHNFNGNVIYLPLKGIYLIGHIFVGNPLEICQVVLDFRRETLH